MTIQPTDFEKPLLAELQAKTGVAFPLLGAIPTRHPECAAQVLPLAVEWIHMASTAQQRSGIYALFDAPTAGPFFDTLIQWWRSEENDLALDLLSQSIAKLVCADDAEKLWRIIRDEPNKPEQAVLLEKLARFRPTASAVKDHIVSLLRTERYRVHDLQHFVRVNDDRVRQWFESEWLHSPMAAAYPAVRKLVERRFKKHRLPSELTKSRVAPDRRAELFSAECDLSELDGLLAEAATRLGLSLPSIAWGEALNAAQVNRWLVAKIPPTGGSRVQLYLRLEDSDAVEFVFVSRSN